MNVGDWVFGEISNGSFAKGFITEMNPFGQVRAYIVEAEHDVVIGMERNIYDPYLVPNTFEGEDTDPAMMVELSLILKDKEMFMKWSGRLANEKAIKTTP